MCSETMSNEWIVDKVRSTFRQASFKDVIEMTVEPLSVVGLNFTSALYKVKLLFTQDNGSKQKLTLISKITETAGSADTAGFYNNRVESRIYFDVLSQMDKLIVEFEDGREAIWPKLYGHIPYTVLLLEDLGAKLFDVRPHYVWFDSEHTLLCLRALGRFHAMSKILLKQGLIDEEYINNYLFGRKSTYNDRCFTGSTYILSEMMIAKEGHWKHVKSSESWGKLLRKILPSISERYEELYLNYDEKFQVLNHGDFRCSNILFRSMEYTGRPIDVKFVDFQLSHVGSFSWDIIYFLSMSVDPVYKRTHRKELLEAYQQSLADNMKFFNYEGYIPTVDDVINEVDRVSFMEFVYMCSLTPFLTSKYDDALAIDKVVTHPPEEAFNKLIYSEESFVKGIIGDFERAIDLKII